MKKLLSLMIAMLLVFAAVPAFAQDTPHECPHGGTTISDLRSCVEHAVMMGHIDNRGIANSLFAKLASAQAAQDRGQLQVAVNVLNALAREVEAQAGKHIDAHHAVHMLNHIQDVIRTLGG